MSVVIVSAPATVVATPPIVAGWVLAACTSPSPLDVLLSVNGYQFTQAEMATAHYALGSKYPAIISDIIGGDDGSFNVTTFEDTTYGKLKTLLRSQAVLWMSSPFGFGRYIRVGPSGGSSASTSGGGGSPLPVNVGQLDPDTGAALVRELAIQFVEQPRPA